MASATTSRTTFARVKAAELMGRNNKVVVTTVELLARLRLQSRSVRKKQRPQSQLGAEPQLLRM